MSNKLVKDYNIKRCPFCGSEVSFMNLMTPMKMFYCTNYKECGAVVSFNNVACDLGGDAPKIKAWNRRAGNERWKS